MQLEDLLPEDRANLPYNHPILDEYATRVAKEMGVDPSLVLAIKNAGEKSGSKSVSSAQARGVMQTIPGTQKMLGIEDPTDPLQSIAGGAKYLSMLGKQLNTTDPVVLSAAYHAGPKSRTVSGDFEGSPKTKSYTERVLQYISGAPAQPQAQKAAMGQPEQPQEVPQPLTKLPAGLSLDDLRPEDRMTVMQAYRKADPGMFDPTHGNSFGQNALIGAGKFFADTGSGIRQLAGNALNPITQALNGKDLIPQDYEGEQARKLQDDALMSTVGGNVGYMGAGATTLALPGGVVAKGVGKLATPVAAMLAKPALAGVLTTAGTGAALSTLTPTTAPGERGVNAAVSAVAGPIMEKGLGAVANSKPVQKALEWAGDNINLGPLLRKSFNASATPEAKNVVAKAIMNDVPVYPQQLDEPGIALSAAKAADQSARLTKAIMATTGEETDNIPGGLAAARAKAGRLYDYALKGKVIPLSTTSGPMPKNALPPPAGSAPSPSPFTQSVKDILAEYRDSRPSLQPHSGLFTDAEAIMGMAEQGGKLTGPQLKNLISNYQAAANAASKTGMVNGQVTNAADHNAAAAYRKMADALREQAVKSGGMTQKELEAFKTANQRWRNIELLDSLAPADINADFNMTTVARKLARQNGHAPTESFPGGTTDIQDLANFGSSYMGMDANTSPYSLWKQAKAVGKSALPVFAAGLGEGAIINAASTGPSHGEDEGALTKVARASAIPLAFVAAAVAGRGSLNKPVSLNALNQPRGAVADLARHATKSFSSPLAAMIAQHRWADEAEPAPYVELRGMAEKE